MLALARKVNESIMIGNDIEITVLEINKNYRNQWGSGENRHHCASKRESLSQRIVCTDSGRE